MNRVEILGLPIDAVTAPELLAELRHALETGRRQWVVTVNNEMLVRADDDPAYRRLLAKAEWRIADSAGVVWASHYRSHPGGYLRAGIQLLRLAIIPRGMGGGVPGTIPGSDLAVELAALAEEFDYRLGLLGAGPGVAERAATELRRRFPRLETVAVEGGRGTAREDAAIRRQLRDVQILLVAYGPPKQDRWIERNLAKLPKPLVAVGVGGTFDYLAGSAPLAGGRAAKQPPAWVRRRGFEWLWRLVTQPSRWRRIVTAGPIFIGRVVRSHRRSA